MSGLAASQLPTTKNVSCTFSSAAWLTRDLVIAGSPAVWNVRATLVEVAEPRARKLAGPVGAAVVEVVGAGRLAAPGGAVSLALLLLLDELQAARTAPAPAPWRKPRRPKWLPLMPPARAHLAARPATRAHRVCSASRGGRQRWCASSSVCSMQSGVVQQDRSAR